MNQLTRCAVATLCAMPLVAGACGDDDASDTGAAAPVTLSDAEYIESGSAVCDDVAPRLMEAFPDPEGEPDVAYLRGIAGPIAEVLEDARGQMAEIDPPADKAAGHESLLAELDSSASELRAVLEDDAAAAAMLEEGPPLDGPSDAAAALGLEGCGP